MNDANFNAEFLMYMLSQMLGTIHRAMLPSSTSEREHERGKATLDIAGHMGVCQPVDTLEEGEYLAIVLQKADDGLVESCELLVWLVAPGVVRRAAVEYIATSVTTLIVGDALAIRERGCPCDKRS